MKLETESLKVVETAFDNQNTVLLYINPEGVIAAYETSSPNNWIDHNSDSVQLDRIHTEHYNKDEYIKALKKWEYTPGLYKTAEKNVVELAYRIF